MPASADTADTSRRVVGPGIARRVTPEVVLRQHGVTVAC